MTNKTGHIFVNDKTMEIDHGRTSVAQILEQLDCSKQVAVALNNEILAHQQWQRPLSSGDRLNVFAAIAGG